MDHPDANDALADDATRPLTNAERDLAQWLLEHGTPAAAGFLAQLGRAQATCWRCPCGCASFDFKIEGLPPAPPGNHVLADFVYGHGDQLKGIFIYESNGTLSGVEVFGYGTGAPAELPNIIDLRPVDKA